MADPVSNSNETTLTTIIYVRRSAQAVDFYTRAFGASSLQRLDNEDGSVLAHLTIGKSNFWVSEESPAHQNFSPESLGGSTLHMVIIDDNPDAVFDQAIAAGATSISPVQDEPYGWRIGRLVDPYGHHWEVGKVLGGA